jgi:hypothetical protein
MAFRVNGLGRGYAKAQAEAARLRSYSVSAQAALAAGNVSANAVIQALTTLTGSIAVFDEVTALPGIAAYAQNEENDPTYDVAAEYTAMRTEAIGARDWILTNFPTAVSGEILKDTLENDGSITVRQFTPAQTAGLQTALGQLIATINAV